MDAKDRPDKKKRVYFWVSEDAKSKKAKARKYLECVSVIQKHLSTTEQKNMSDAKQNPPPTGDSMATVGNAPYYPPTAWEVFKSHMSGTFLGGIPTWVLYVVIFLFVTMLSWGIWQRVQLHRWGKLLKAAKVRILDLETQQEYSKWQVTKELATKAETLNQKKVDEIDTKLKTLEKKKEEIKKQVDSMKPDELLKAFKEEGF